MKALILKHREWNRIFSQIMKDYAHSPATYLIRSRMKADLGFTYREHEEWVRSDENVIEDWRDNRSQIHIDFYSESARTFFLLRYMNREENHTD